MKKVTSTTNEDSLILRAIFKNKHLTTADIHRYAVPCMNRRTLQRRLKALVDRGLINSHVLKPGQGARSPRLYHVLLNGARAIGEQALAKNHYRFERADFYAFRRAVIELEHIARQQPGWHVWKNEQDCQRALERFLEAVARHQHGEAPSFALAHGFMPAKLTPDLILQVGGEAIPVIVAHPHASGRGFWKRRIKKYERLLHTIRAIAIVLDPFQEKEARASVRASGHEKRILVTTTERLEKLLPALGYPAYSAPGSGEG